MTSTVTTPTNLVLLGLGQMARNHYIPTLLEDHRAALTAFVDPNQDNIERIVHSHPALQITRPPIFRDVTELLEATRTGQIAPIDGAFVLTHPGGREAIVLPLLEAGIPVMQEKPGGVGLRAPALMAQAAQATATTCVVNQTYRVWTRRFRRWFQQELTGQWTYARGMWVRHNEPRIGPFADPLNGGRVYDVGAHVLAAILEPDGFPRVVQAAPVRMDARERTVHTHMQLLDERGAHIEIQLADVLATSDSGVGVLWRCHEDFELNLRFPTFHRETTDFRAVVSRREHQMPTTTTIEEIPPTVPEMNATNIRDFVSCVRGELILEAETALTTIHDSVAVTDVLALMYAAHERGRPVTYDELLSEGQ